MDISVESLRLDDEPRGALLRRTEPGCLRALDVRRTDDGLRRVEHRVEHGGDVRDWTAWTRTDRHGTATVRRPSPTTLQGDGGTVEIPADTVPGAAARVLLAEMLAGSHTEEEFHELTAPGTDETPAPAHFSVGNPEVVTIPGQGPRELGTVVLYRGEEVSRTYWFDSHEVVLAECDGAIAQHVDSLDELLAALDDEAAAAVREWLG